MRANERENERTRQKERERTLARGAHERVREGREAVAKGKY